MLEQQWIEEHSGQSILDFADSSKPQAKLTIMCVASWLLRDKSWREDDAIRAAGELLSEQIYFEVDLDDEGNPVPPPFPA